MARTYRNIGEAYRDILEVKIIELAPHVYRVKENLLGVFKPPREGLYIPGFVEPAFVKGYDYYVSGLDDRSVIKATYEEILNDRYVGRGLAPGNFYNTERKKHMTRFLYERIKRTMQEQPSVPSTGFDAAIAAVLGYLNSLNKHTHVAHRHYDLYMLLQEPYRHLAHDGTFDVAFSPLLEEIMEFVGRDTWNIYFFKVVGMTLIIEKGQDYRIIEHTRREIEKLPNYDHDHGGVYDGYPEWPLTSKEV